MPRNRAGVFTLGAMAAAVVITMAQFLPFPHPYDVAVMAFFLGIEALLIAVVWRSISLSGAFGNLRLDMAAAVLGAQPRTWWPGRVRFRVARRLNRFTVGADGPWPVPGAVRAVNATALQAAHRAEKIACDLGIVDEGSIGGFWASHPLQDVRTAFKLAGMWNSVAPPDLRVTAQKAPDVLIETADTLRADFPRDTFTPLDLSAGMEAVITRGYISIRVPKPATKGSDALSRDTVDETTPA